MYYMIEAPPIPLYKINEYRNEMKKSLKQIFLSLKIDFVQIFDLNGQMWFKII